MIGEEPDPALQWMLQRRGMRRLQYLAIGKTLAHIKNAAATGRWSLSIIRETTSRLEVTAATHVWDTARATAAGTA